MHISRPLPQSPITAPPMSTAHCPCLTSCCPPPLYPAVAAFSRVRSTGQRGFAFPSFTKNVSHDSDRSCANVQSGGKILARVSTLKTRSMINFSPKRTRVNIQAARRKANEGLRNPKGHAWLSKGINNSGSIQRSARRIAGRTMESLKGLPDSRRGRRIPIGFCSFGVATAQT